MYRNYYNEYARRAEEIKSAVQEAPKDVPAPPEKKNKKPVNSFLGLKGDDILLGALILFLMREEKADKTLILALVFIFMSDFN